LKVAVEALHRAGTLHITDYAEQYEGFRLGTPLPGAAAHSEKLLKLRASTKALGIGNGSFSAGTRSSKWARERLDGLLVALEGEVAAPDKLRQDVEGNIRVLEKRKEAVLPFAELPLPFEAYGPYDSLAVFTGTVRTPIGAELSGLTDRYELFESGPDGPVGLFVELRIAQAAEKLLSRHEFSEVRVPFHKGTPADVLRDIDSELASERAKLERLRKDIEEAREKYHDEILACSEELAVEIDKAEAPLRFATTETSFVVEGWIPSDELDRTENALIKATDNRVFIERILEKEWLAEDERATPAGASPTLRSKGQGRNEVTGKGVADGKSGPEAGEGADIYPFESVPIALSNPGPVKPFEALTEMFSLPNYKEIDPTVLVALVFPFFFGLMIGDAGYGALLIITGILFRVKLKKWDGFPEIGWYIIVAGIVALLFGLFIFGDAFGLPFHAEAGGSGAMEMSWYSLTGVDIPLHGSVHKLESSGLGTLMMFSVLAGVAHLSLGNILGIINERHHRRHWVAKLGWLCAVLGFGLFLFKFGERTVIGRWIWNSPAGVLSPSWDPGIGILVPYASVALLGLGTALAVACEGGMAAMEVLGVLSNILSYTRLAAIGVAKAAMALAFNILLIPLVISGNIGYVVAGWFLLVLSHMLVFVLGGLSSGIQALRLNLVEFFMKFYKGGGTKFNPFGYLRRYTQDS
jgi:V/A-type H+-transporting ATPase subunit I